MRGSGQLASTCRMACWGAVAVLLLSGGCGTAPPGPVATGPAVGNFALLDQDGGFHELYYYSNFRAVLLAVQSIGCQIARHQLPELQRLRDEFETQGVKFLGLDASLQDDRQAIAEFKDRYSIEFPILMDESQHVARSLGLERTGEILLIETASWRVAYRGPVDDRLDYEVQRSRAGRSYLRNAIESLLQGRPIDNVVVGSPGCLINFRPLSEQELSFSDSIVPILRERCLDCHRNGGVAPFAMDSYRTVFGWAPMIREVVRTRRMPPWRLDPHVGNIAFPRTMTVDEERILLGWIDAGAPGEPVEDALSGLVPDPGKWSLGEPDLILEFEEQLIPSSGTLGYRYVQAKVGNDRSIWLRAMDLVPSDPQVFHHGLAALSTREESLRDPRTWFRKVLSTHAPGTGPNVWPATTGRHLPPQASITLQLHYTPNGKETVDRPRMGLYLLDAPPDSEMRVDALISYDLRIPPGHAHVPVRAAMTLAGDRTLYKVRPHMHYRGRSLQLWATPPDSRKSLILRVPNYSFDWQPYYRLSQPLHLPAGTLLEVEAIFDNSAQNRFNPDPSKEVGWGLGQVEDEMMIVYLEYTKGLPRKVESTEG